MKKGDLYRLKAGFEGLGDVRNGSFAFKVIKNLSLITTEIELLDKLREPTPEFVEKVQTPIQALVRKFAETDTEGNVIEEVSPEGTSIKVAEDKKDEFMKARDKVLKEEAALQAEYELQIKGFDKVLDEDLDIQFKLFTEKDIPNDVSIAQLYQIKELLVD